MTAPAGPSGPTSVTLEEMENAQTTELQKPASMAEVKLEGEEVPETFRGKSAADVLAENARLIKALQTSEHARLTAEASASRSAATPAPAPPPPEEPKDLTDEELAELHEKNPVEAIRVMNAQAERRIMKNVNGRIQPLMTGTTSSAEAAARQKFATEFELFGQQISEIVNNMPNKAEVFSNPKAWEDAISWVRGMPGNFERLVEHRAGAKPAPTQQDAQRREAETIGFSGTGAGSRPIPRSVAQLDATQLEIARNLDMTPEEYVKWSNI